MYPSICVLKKNSCQYSMAHLPRKVAAAIGAANDAPAEHWTPEAISAAVAKLDEYAVAHHLRDATVRQYRSALRVFLRDRGVPEQAICQSGPYCGAETLWRAYSSVPHAVRDQVWALLRRGRAPPAPSPSTAETVAA